MFPETGPRVPLLELADVRGGPIMAQGRGAPLDLRLMVAACILTPHAARASLGAVWRVLGRLRRQRKDVATLRCSGIFGSGLTGRLAGSPAASGRDGGSHEFCEG